jgi:hypothetical protein
LKGCDEFTQKLAFVGSDCGGEFHGKRSGSVGPVEELRLPSVTGSRKTLEAQKAQKVQEVENEVGVEITTRT